MDSDAGSDDGFLLPVWRQAIIQHNAAAFIIKCTTGKL